MCGSSCEDVWYKLDSMCDTSCQGNVLLFVKDVEDRLCSIYMVPVVQDVQLRPFFSFQVHIKLQTN